MHGLGNDFVVVDTMTQDFTPDAHIIRTMGDRRFGVGFDQFLLLSPSSDEVADFNYRIFNADGNEVEACGNGARCIGRYISIKQLSDKRAVVLQTKAGQLRVTLNNDDVVVDLGVPELALEKIPYLGKGLGMLQYESYHGETLEFSMVGMGNPHVVIFIEDDNQYDIDAIGEWFNQHPHFPEGANVSFARRLSDERVTLQVYERGVGRTLACGTAACAVVVAGKKRGILSSNVIVEQLGGDLVVQWNKTDGPVMLQGAADYVFRGEW